MLLCHIDGPGAAPQVETIPIGHFQWEKRALSLQSAEDLAMLDALLGGLSTSPERLVVDLTLSGSLPVSLDDSLRGLLAEWQAKLHLLRVHDSGLLQMCIRDRGRRARLCRLILMKRR